MGSGTQVSETTHDRLVSEAAFHDNSFANDVRAAAGKFYSVMITSTDRYRHLLFQKVAGRRFLEYGCGTGSSAFDLARKGGDVVGIDISPVAIEMATRKAQEEHLEGRTEFVLMNAEELAFPDASFDMICGTAILHHLDLERSYSEIARVMKPGELAVFLEPLGHNPFINWYRNRTPEMRTPDEHPLLMRDIELARKYFSSVEVRYFHLFSLALVPLRSTFLFKPLYAMAEGLDRITMSLFPPLKRWAWYCVMELRT
jgi:ubiquinone/menaquinone biosynthesis C-methylase UbiE